MANLAAIDFGYPIKRQDILFRRKLYNCKMSNKTMHEFIFDKQRMHMCWNTHTLPWRNIWNDLRIIISVR